MFEQEFYPTPENVLAKMFKFLEVNELRTVLEPSAGKGDILDALCKRLYHSNKIDIDCIEIDENLQSILKGKKYRGVHGDFLTKIAREAPCFSYGEERAAPFFIIFIVFL